MNLLKITRDKSGAPWISVDGSQINLNSPEIKTGHDEAKRKAPECWWIEGNNFMLQFLDEADRNTVLDRINSYISQGQAQVKAEKIVDEGGEIKIYNNIFFMFNSRFISIYSGVKSIQESDYYDYYYFKVERYSNAPDHTIYSDNLDDLSLQRAIILVMQDRVKNPPAKAEETEAENE